MKYYVVTDQFDPGSEHDTYEEAREVLNSLRPNNPDARIICSKWHYLDYDENNVWTDLP